MAGSWENGSKTYLLRLRELWVDPRLPIVIGLVAQESLLMGPWTSLLRIDNPGLC